MASTARGAIDDDIAAFFLGPVSAMLATADGTGFPDVTRITGLVALDDRRLRVLIADDANVARANATPGARAAVLVTDILSYRSLSLKGTVTEAGQERTPGDLAMADRHVAAFVGASPLVGLDPVLADGLFASEVRPLVITVDRVFDQTPGPGAGRQLAGRR